MTSIWLYRGIENSKRVWNGNPNDGFVQAPEEKGYYDLIELADENNNHVEFKWEKSQYTKPEVSYASSWYPIPDTNWR